MKGILIILIILLSSSLKVFSEENRQETDSIRKILSDKSIPFEKRYNVFMKEYGLRERINAGDPAVEEFCRILLPEAEKFRDKEKELYLRYYIIDYNLAIERPEAIKPQIDTVLVLIPKTENAKITGALYSHISTHYARAGNELLCNEYLYKAIDYYKKRDDTKELIGNELNSMAGYYMKVDDYRTVKKFADEILAIATDYRFPRDSVNAYFLMALYCSSLAKKDTARTVIYTDSCMYYERQCLAVFSRLENPDLVMSAVAFFNCNNLADDLITRNEPGDLEEALELIEYGYRLLAKYPLYIIPEKNLTYRNIRGNVFLKQKKYELAFKEAQMQLEILDEYADAEYLDSEHRETYKLLSDLYEATGQYALALKYEKLRNEYNVKIIDNEKFDAIKGVKTKYELAKKDDEIRQLKEITRYQNRIYRLIAGLALALIAGALFVIRSQRMKHKHIAAQLQITQLKKEEAELQAQLQEEKFRREETDKYEALVDIHFKELELTGKTKELESLAKEKEDLQKQLKENAKIVDEYKSGKQKMEAKLNINSLKSFFSDMEKIILSKLGKTARSKEYLNRLNELDESALIQLDNRTNGSLSATYIRYCICFMIGMEIKDISDCFHIEPSSIHMIRYRLKQRLGLTKDEDLDFYFNNLRRIDKE